MKILHLNRSLLFLHVLTAIMGLTFALAHAQVSQAQPAPSSLTVIQAPRGCFVPDVAVDAQGVIHMVYALDRNAWYTRSADHGQTFSAPAKVNTVGLVTFTMGERGPKLALGKGGSIHVAWQDLWTPGAKVFARTARSLDGGKTFEPPKAVAATPGDDGVSIAADAKGNVAVFWHVMSPVQKVVPQATWLHLARSTDGGVTFTPEEHVRIDKLSELACSMCMTRARSGPDG